MKKNYSLQLTRFAREARRAAHSVTKKRGQILVIILLVMVVGLTVGLFLLGRTTVDISLTTKIADSSRAFNAAEAGIEEAIRGSVAEGIPVSFAPDVSYTVTTSNLGGSNGIYPETVAQPTEIGQSFTVWLVPHRADGTLDTSNRYYTQNYIDLCFNEDDTSTDHPAMGVTVYYIDRSGTAVERSSYIGYDSQSTRTSLNKFIYRESGLPPCNGYFTNTAYRVRIYFGDRPGPLSYDFGVNLYDGANPRPILLALRIRPLYERSSIAVIPQGGAGGNLPVQGNDIISTGNALETTRRINVQEPYLEPAPFMDHAVYSLSTTNDLTHN